MNVFSAVHHALTQSNSKDNEGKIDFVVTSGIHGENVGLFKEYLYIRRTVVGNLLLIIITTLVIIYGVRQCKG